MDTQAESLICKTRDHGVMAKLIGKSEAFLKAIGQLPAIAKAEASVLITGETGTGKELVARAIHYLSERAAFPFIAINCGSLPDTLLEDELFGHERGAFTDAHARRSGLINQAEKGTLFLDEVDALTRKAQVTLLRVLQDKRFRAIGSCSEQQADVRILAASNVAIDQLVQTGQLRADLYYRLNVFSVNLPSLRERREDILVLAAHFLSKHALSQKAALWLTPAACAQLVLSDWPGNVRELESAIIRGIHLSRNGVIDVSDLGLNTIPGPQAALAQSSSPDRLSFKAGKQAVIKAFEKDYLIRIMYEYHGNISRAAQAAGKERREFGKLLKKYQLDPNVFRAPSAHPTR
jgi:DNA-binding NtrC family response regulator